MRTLYIRNVPEDVAAAVDELAERAGVSVNTLVISELTALTERSRNAAVLASLPSLNIDPADVVDVIHEARSERNRHVDRAVRGRDRRR